MVNPFEARRLRFNMEKVSAIGVELDGRIRALDMNPVALNASGLQPMVLDAKIHLVQRWRPQITLLAGFGFMVFHV